MLSEASEAPEYITSFFVVISFAALIIAVSIMLWLWREYESDSGDRNKPISQKTMRKYQNDEEHP